VRATLDETDGHSVVVACPPHPEFGGDRRDSRLRAVGDALGERGVACLRFDYGPWTGGAGECADAEQALAWAGERYDRVGLFGYSFGGAVALTVAADAAQERAEDDTGDDTVPAAVSVLAPAASVGERDAAAAVEHIDPLQVVVGERDETVDWERVATRAAACGATVERVPADHFLVGGRERVAALVADFLAGALGP
jgi:alpha/beta superfamily hydrolase